MKAGSTSDFSEMTARMESCGVPPRLREDIVALARFHTAPAPGVIIGAFMVDYAMELLSATPDEKLFGVCETPKCLPDALQVLAHCTTGNGRLRVVPIGKFAITMNRATMDTTAEGVRISVDVQKLKKFRILDLWYANDPGYVKATMRDTLQEEIFRAGRSILSAERVRVGVSPKQKWKSVTCRICGEPVPDYLMTGDRCGACGSMKYYEKI